MTSYSGWMHFDPLPKREAGLSEQQFQDRVRNLPPLFGGSRWIPPKPTLPDDPGSYEPREGYFAFAAWACYNFVGDGTLTGIMDFNRGGPGKLVRNKLTGTYSIGLHPALNVYVGRIDTLHTNLGGFPRTNQYSFIMKSPSELDWVWGDRDKERKDRALVTHGTLTRVAY